jgi:RimJ/RimL family protein N-acetyltransferase
MFTIPKSPLFLCPIEESDLGFIKDLRNDQSTWENLTDIWPLNEVQQNNWFEKLSVTRDQLYMIVRSQPQQKQIGMTRMKFDWINRSVCLGADIHPDQRGRGLGTLTYDLILAYVFNYLNMHRAWLLVLDTNTTGIHIYQGKGFIEEGRLRQAVYRDGRWHDYIAMGLLHGEYSLVS